MEQKEFKPINAIFTEKYRPTKVSDMVGDFKNKILKYLQEPNSMPHFLLHSKTPGTGKTTLAKAIINEVGCDALILNSSDDRKIEVIREKVKEFSITKSSKEGLRRCVFLDEFDGMLKTSQDALRNVMETYASNVFFILTCNNINKIIDPLQSRCQVIEFSYPERKEIYEYLVKVLEQEEMQYTEEGVYEIISLNYPSIRNCIKKIQDLKIEGLTATKENVKPSNNIYEQMWKHLEEKEWDLIKKYVLESNVDPRELNDYFWNKALETNNIKLIQYTCRNEKDIAVGADAKIVFVSSLIDMVK